MKHHYEDIRTKINEEPQWWDEHAVPRYCRFSPRETANIYARQVVLYEIACQNCGHRFKVCESWTPYDSHRKSLVEDAKAGRLHYGDPPNINCCPSGPTMNSEFIKVLEIWQYEREQFDWEKIPNKSLEPDA